MTAKKLLFVANEGRVASYSFFASSIHAAHECGLEPHLAFNWLQRTDHKITDLEKTLKCKFHQIDFIRNPLHPCNFRAYRQLMELMLAERFDIVHCNTPIGGLLGRICALRANCNYIIYMAHGFHFWDGAPILNRVLYKPVEQVMAFWTDTIITINKEDFEAAKKFRLRRGGKAYFVRGVGIDTLALSSVTVDKSSKRSELGLTNNDIVLISLGDLIKRKNYQTAIEAIKLVGDLHVHLLICGTGPEGTRLKKLAQELNVEDRVHFLGFRNDAKELLGIADIFLLTSRQEGLARSLLEAMACGLPCVVSRIRGNVDLIENGENGHLCDPMDTAGFARSINILASDATARQRMRLNNIDRIKDYDITTITAQIKQIYSEALARL